MSDVYYYEKYDDVLDLVKRTCDTFVLEYDEYISRLECFDICITIRRCCFFNGKYHTRIRKKGCDIFMKISLFPKGYSYTQAKKRHWGKEMFSKKIMEFKETSKGYRVKVFGGKDNILKSFLKGRLRRCEKLNNRGKESKKSVKESLADVFRSFILVHRYRNQVKTTFYGFDLHWIILIIAIILIWLETDAYFDFITS